MTHTHHQPHTDGHGHDNDTELAKLLDLDAQVLGSYLDKATSWVADLIKVAPGIVVDVGCGSGAGTTALAGRFPHAGIVAIDKSPAMLERTREAARGQGYADRLGTVEADLGAAWPEVGRADLVWASSFLHELADPDRALRDMFGALAPGGWLVVLEMDSLPRFLPDGGEPGLAGLESRLHSALARQGWNAHPNWRDALLRAGFERVDQGAFPTTAGTTAEISAHFARTYLARIRTAVAGSVSAKDLASLDLLLSGHGTESLENRRDLKVRGSRTAWAARRPD